MRLLIHNRMTKNRLTSFSKIMSCMCFALVCIAGLGFRQVNATRKTAKQDPSTEEFKREIIGLNIAGLTIDQVLLIDQGTYTPKSTNKPLNDLPAFYLVAITLKPTAQSDIKIELWLPRDNWNGRLLGTGNGGGAGSISYPSLVGGIKNGYATVNTDMGTSHGGANGAVEKPEVWADFGYRATHQMTVVAKAILKRYYGKAQSYAYFVGCSTGGQQALMEAQRFPDDYNGIIAGAPANNRTHLHTDFLLNYVSTNSNGKPIFSAADLTFISKKITQAYALKSGGAPGDHFLTDPRLATVNFDELFKCKIGRADTCLSDVQLQALKAIYRGAVNIRTNEQIYTAPPVGSESVGGGLNSQQTSTGANELFYQFKWAFGNNFDPLKFDFDRDQDKMDAALALILNANNPDLSRMKKLGGKIIMYTGTADPLVPYQDALNYYERVIKKQQGLKQTQDFFRYFLIPGMGHCSGGPGLQGFSRNILTDMVSWVERGKAPEQLLASGIACCGIDLSVRFERPVFPYPKFPKYVGGDVNAASSYIGIDHARHGVLKPAERYLK